MSLYNSIFNTNAFLPLGLKILGLTESDCGRLRDVFTTVYGGELAIGVYTRNGGGNREHWEYAEDASAGKDCTCPGCIITHRLPEHPLYIDDKDDDFDETYATIYFGVPEEYRDLIATVHSNGMTEVPEDKWKRFFDDLNEV